MVKHIQELNTQLSKLSPSEEKQQLIATLNKLQRELTNKEEEIKAVSVYIGSSSIGVIDKAPIKIQPKTKYLHIASKTWAPRNITIKILDQDGNIVFTESNQKNSVTSFIFPISRLKDGYKVKIVDGFNDLLVDSEIKF